MRSVAKPPWDSNPGPLILQKLMGDHQPGKMHQTAQISTFSGAILLKPLKPMGLYVALSIPTTNPHSGIPGTFASDCVTKCLPLSVYLFSEFRWDPKCILFGLL